MAGYRVSTNIERSPEDVFAYITDASRTREWAPAVIESRSDGPLRTGQTGVEVRKVMGRRLELRWEVTELEQNRRYGFRYTSGPLPAESRFVLEPEGTGTNVTCETRLSPRGMLKAVAAIVRREAKKEDQANLRRLKAALEKETRPGQDLPPG